MTTKEDIRSWIESYPKPDNATHMIVATDTFDYEDYPVFVIVGQAVHTEVARLQKQDMTRVMEVYNLSLPIEAQLNERRSWHLE